ncbi:hypothetical protein Tco_0878213 [Tanacetum coccineum]|uniref:Uncharacterized protein n=1 Tax=Tanacetum coccineum TaxID=301880 RepID=A0ABQ5BZR4_9ASTR
MITADVPEIYMRQFWFTIDKKDSTSYQFKIDKKRYIIDMEVFREILQICPKLLNQEFDALPSDEEIVSFIKELGHKGDIKSVTNVVVDQMYQPWRTFASIINTCLSGKITGLDKLRLSRAQILWGMFNKKNVDFVKLLWEDFTFQIENRDTKNQEKMYYLRFIKVIIHHFITKDKSISMRNRMFMHIVDDDNILGPMRFVSKADDYQVYGTLLPEKPASSLRKRTLVTVEEEDPKPAKKVAPSKKPSRKQSTGVQIRDTPGVSVSKKKAPATTDKSKGIYLLSRAALLEEAQFETRESEYESWGDSGDEANVQETNDDEEESDNKFVHTPEDYVPTDDERNNKTKDIDEEEYDRIDKELYGDVNVRVLDVVQDDEGEEDADMINVAHVQNATTEVPPLSSSHSVSSTYTNAFLNLENLHSTKTEVVSILDINVQHEVPCTSPLLTIPISVIPKHIVFHPSETVIAAPATTITYLLSSLFPSLQQSIPIPTPTNTEATSTIAVPESETLYAIHQRITDLEKDVKGLKSVNNSTTVTLAIKSEVPNAIKEYL